MIVIVEPATGVELLGVSVHTGTAGAAQLTWTAPELPVPKPLVPLTKYVCEPGVVFVSWHDAVLLQFDVGGAVHV